MKRSIRALLATSAVVALTGTGLAPAAAAEAPPELPLVIVDERFNDKYKFPAGTACKDTIKIKERYDYKLTILKDTARQIKLKEEYDNGWAKFYNPRTGKSAKVRLDSTSIIRDNKRSHVARVKGRGSDYLQGPGIKGIVQIQGKYNVTVYNTDDPFNVKFQIDRVQGKYVELCHKLGSRPVNGKLVLPPSAQLEEPQL